MLGLFRSPNFFLSGEMFNFQCLVTLVFPHKFKGILIASTSTTTKRRMCRGGYYLLPVFEQDESHQNRLCQSPIAHSASDDWQQLHFYAQLFFIISSTLQVIPPCAPQEESVLKRLGYHTVRSGGGEPTIIYSRSIRLRAPPATLPNASKSQYPFFSSFLFHHRPCFSKFVFVERPHPCSM